MGLLAGDGADADAEPEAGVDADETERVDAIGVLRADHATREPAVVEAEHVRTDAAEAGCLTARRSAAVERAVGPTEPAGRAVAGGRARRADAVTRAGRGLETA